MEKKKILWIVGIILIIAAIIILFFTLRKPGYHTAFQEKYDTCISDQSEQYNVIMAEKTGDEKYCKKVSSEAQAYCFAVARKDAAACQSFEEDNKRKCLIAITKNPELCSLDDVDCAAKVTGDIKFCTDNYVNPDYLNMCIAKATLDADYFLNEETKRQCADESYLMVMQVFRDKKICDKISDPLLKDQCLAVVS
jgi:hypothetical protein